jgi:hypothetical protein
MYYENGGWMDFPKDVVDLVKKDFEVKKAVVEFEFNGHHLLLNFLHMYQMDLKTGLQKPIAWIDEKLMISAIRTMEKFSNHYLKILWNLMK